ncbi:MULTISPECIES: NAD(P)-dependent oxidoreductase [Clostridium]|jgi:Lactate dehydrogenase and related dehydrogenases|uniref:D-2-hydroxyacid dehydrogenase n=2 Tax=Clostridium beijerinckii TaxID=1520 RepID=A0A1S8P8L3_CLOBE|nr:MULTISPECIES: NAD(P)-dependent oxidoreductase [Clostridium]ABR34116.1 D-isomer specific 2-hydroxyacid dehydrogenase, NAD-binding [Clostridium beijerinckii NCIMB 8052]AIU02150.1 D-isomer specific 2-hydroxyacid dehydrogenase, NAD-binding protein [Clostridium beijerinckii ATCC 35702]MBC2458410.1 D-2-hydroxyacid dehydrogenase [Clostridium beijerinckii]MBC2475751.1 D-2-hydroxyacid dehydrogenase [Clostridium beijerinckii]MBF7811280.1 D-2-hydroxyacid dehydrogenase [Clostridium beijerinckii]
MNKIVFLNASRINFDGQLDFSSLDNLGKVTKYEDSSNDEILERVKEQNIVITKELTINKELIEKFPSSVKLICEAGTGYNNIDIIAAREKGISVCNVPGYSSEAVAQLVITFILNLSSSLAQQQRMIENKNYSNFTKYLQVPHIEIQNKTLGIIGAGSIGIQVMNVAKALGMKILIYSRSYKDLGDSNIKFVSLEELLKESDFVTIHCPLTTETRYLIDKSRLDLMKSSSFIINTSRGAIIKETDLIEALNNKKIAGAALDVQDPEPPELNNPLFNMENVILTPHIGWKCFESRQRLINLLANNIEAFIKNEPVNIIV